MAQTAQQRLEALRERLHAGGYETVDDELIIGYNRFYVQDPFGNRIEFIEPILEPEVTEME